MKKFTIEDYETLLNTYCEGEECQFEIVSDKAYLELKEEDGKTLVTVWYKYRTIINDTFRLFTKNIDMVNLIEYKGYPVIIINSLYSKYLYIFIDIDTESKDYLKLLALNNI